MLNKDSASALHTVSQTASTRHLHDIVRRNQNSASAPTMNRVGHQDSASAPTPHPSNPCPYKVEMWHLTGGGSPVHVAGGEG